MRQGLEEPAWRAMGSWRYCLKDPIIIPLGIYAKGVSGPVRTHVRK